MIGQVLSQYRIEAELGSGGMGVVYLAYDTRLRRKVAIKLLTGAPPDTVHARLLREARAASALNHPNICTVYEVDEAAGQVFIAMEYVEGTRLRDLCSRGGLPLQTVIRLGLQIADALAYAHDHGVVHRDLKSTNILVTPDGTAKVLDFGLAERAPGPDLELEEETHSRRSRPAEVGAFAGTLPYVAPEVLQGQGADARADIWALGVVLHELSSGELPFTGGSSYEVAASVLNKTAPSLPGVPQGLSLLIQRCLAKERAQRYQRAGEVRAALEAVQADSTDTAPRLQGAGASRRARSPAQVVAIGALLAMGVVAYLFFPRTPSGGTGPGFVNPVQLTTAVGVEDNAAWSPDGEMLAYSVNPSADVFGGNWDIYVMRAKGGPSVNRTPDHAGDDRFPSWSPDGAHIAFWSDRDDGGYFLMPSLAGAPRKILPTPGLFGVEGSPPQWIGNGEQLGCIVKDGRGFSIETIALSGESTGRLELPELLRPLDLSWSPSGRFVAFVDAGNRTAQVSRLWLLRVTDERLTPITDGWSSDWSPSWSSDERALYFVSNRGGAMDLWRQRLADGMPVGAPLALTTGVGIRHALFSPDGTQLVYSRGQRLGNLWRIPVLPDRPATWADAEQITFDQALIESVDVSPDGLRLLVSSDRSGNPDLWTLPVSRGELQQLTTDRSPDWSPEWSPDGREIAFYAYRSGNRDIWKMPAGAGAPIQLTTHEAADAFPSWSPDGRQIAFLSDRSGNSDLWVMPVTGGEARQLTTHPDEDFFPEWSPDGRFIAFASRRTGDWRLWRLTLTETGVREERLTDGPAFRPRWSLDGTSIYFVGWGSRSGNLWNVTLEPRVERQLTAFRGRRGTLGGLVLATDGRFLYFTWEEDVGDLWLMQTTGAERTQ